MVIQQVANENEHRAHCGHIQGSAKAGVMCSTLRAGANHTFVLKIGKLRPSKVT